MSCSFENGARVCCSAEVQWWDSESQDHPESPPPTCVYTQCFSTRFTRQCTQTTGGSYGSRWCADLFLRLWTWVNSVPSSLNFTQVANRLLAFVKLQPLSVERETKHKTKWLADVENVSETQSVEVMGRKIAIITFPLIFFCSSKCSNVYNTNNVLFIILFCASLKKNIYLNYTQSLKFSQLLQ